MPFAVYMLGLAVFAQSTSEFMLSGLVPAIAGDLHVSIGDAGLLTSAFAVGMVIGGPLLAVLTLRWSRRRALVAFLLVFVLVHVLGALTSNYGVLLVTRVVGALANAGFWAVAAGAAVGMVPADARARAMSIVVGGTTLACVAGVPGGALLGQQYGWRSAFWAVAVLAAASVVAVLLSLPDDRPETSGTSVRSELRALANRELFVAYAMNALVQGGTFCTFTFLAPLLTDVTGFGAGRVPVMLVLFGVGAFTGITIGGRVADARPFTVLFCGMTALTLGWSLLALTAGNPVMVVLLVFIQGFLAFGAAPALTSRTFSLAGNAPTLAGGFMTAAFNIGNIAGPWFGAVVIEAGLGFRAPAWVSAVMTAGALATVVLAFTLHRRKAEKNHHAPVPVRTP
ncbi:Cmx/CmrA family chloramphenicol efflux MFS transporter [Streptomyces sp. MST-110588]|uniref:Cmx/CmrA family chloramphenicol efflux MFS transporter n=1 Tax=Streptomyces sp. MST-110588 TaxID=2833628 RepID=UPI001F5DE6C1|nr:Cmx/CmrA family chloramphenicol efflux MFS transporter [Streptomyces sp. MST-110588]UNO43118.1 MFS transporter [Streptomyces sp. MST-110588]